MDMNKILETFVTSVVQAHQAGVSVGMLRAHLLLQGMDGEETSLLLEIVAVEVRKAPPKKGQVIDVYA